jgi:hypothetical protein
MAYSGISPKPNSFVFKPGGTNSSNVYTSWQATYSAASASLSPAVIYVDSSISTATVPSGVWDLAGIIELRGLQKVSSLSTLVLADGAVLRNPYKITDYLTISAQSSTQSMDWTLSNSNTLMMDNNAVLINDGSGYIMNSSATNAHIVLRGGSQMLKNTASVMYLPARATATIELHENSVLGLNAISGNITAVANVKVLSLSAVTNSQSAVGYTPTYTPINSSNSTISGLVHSGSGNPGAPPPSFVQGNSSSGLTVTTSRSVTAGNVLVVLAQTESAISSVGSVTVTDTIGTTYTAVANSIGNSGVNGILYAGIAPSSGSVTITGNQVALYARMTVSEFNNVSATVDGSAAVYSASTTNVTATSTNSIILGAVGSFHSASTFTPGTGFLSATSGNGSDASFMEYNLSPIVGTNAVGYTSTTSTSNDILLAAVLHYSPFVTVGNDGDFYIDTLNKEVYGPRTTGVYPYLSALGINGASSSITVNSANVTLTALQAARPTIFINGTLTGNRNLIVDHTTINLKIGDSFNIINTCTGPYTITFLVDNSGVGLWIPPTGTTISVVWNGSDFIYKDSGGGFVLQSTQTVAAGGASGPTYSDIWQIPTGWMIAGAVARSTQTGSASGSVTTSLGTSHGGGELIAAHTPGSSGVAFTHTGSGFTTGNEVVSSGQTISATQQNTGTVSVAYIESYTLRVVSA